MKKVLFAITALCCLNVADVAYCLCSKEDGRATTSKGTKFKTSTERKVISIDIRPRIQVSANYNKTGAYVGYSLVLQTTKRILMAGITSAMQGFCGLG